MHLFRQVDADTAVDGMSVPRARTIVWLPFAGLVILAAGYAVHPRTFYWLMVEDHPVEWGQFAFLVFGVLAAALAALRLARRGSYGLAAVLVLAMLGLIGLAGEEVSWGERIFSLAPPADLASINRQGELNLHNLDVDGVSVDFVSKVIELAMALGAILLSLLSRTRNGALAGTWLRQVAPPLATVPAFGLMACYQVAMLSTGTTAAPAILFQEWMEFCFYLGIALTTAACWVRAGAGPDVGGDAAVDAGAGDAGAGDAGAGDAGASAGRRPLVVAVLLALVVTGVSAQLSAQSKVLPGNVPPSLLSLYGSF